jgi:hypothetical protein
MLSLTHGKKIARVVGTNEPQKFIYLTDEKEEPEIEQDPADILDELEDFRTAGGRTKRIPQLARARILYALRNGGAPHGYEDIYERNKQKVIQTRKKQYDLQAGFLSLIPADGSERVYITGRSGAGKSTLCARYMVEYLIKYPERKILLFSTHENEPAYAQIPHIPVLINDEMLNDPLSVQDLENTLVVFDDCDNLQDKEHSKAIYALVDDLIANGRKYGIHVIFLAHQMMNYKATRNILNEAQKVVFFPAGGTYHQKRYLKEYAGFNPPDIKKILSFRSRWVCCCLEVPLYVIHEHGVYIPERV